MKDFIKKCLINFSLIIISVFLFSGIVNNQLCDFIFIAQILAATVVIHLCQLLTNRFQSIYHLLEVTVEFLMVMTVVLLFGWIFKWYTLSYMWLMFVIVIPVYIFCYILDIARTKKDIDFINQRLRQRKCKLGKSEEV